MVAVLLQAGILLVLVLGLRVVAVEHPDSGIALFTTAPEPPPPPPPVIPPKERTRGKEGASAPANIKSTATEVTAPPPVIPPLQPPPIVAAPTPNVGTQATQGAAPVAGPGTGAGGVGNGTGSGGRGNGDGGGETPPRWMSGRLRFADLPPELVDQDLGGSVEVKYAVEPDGSVDDCRVTRSSGNRLLDQTTCRLIEQRFRYRPSYDADGQAVRSYIVETHSWSIDVERREDEGDYRGRRRR